MERECIVLIHITVHLKVESTLNREASYLWTVPLALSMALLPGSAERLMRTPHAEKHTSGVLESRRVTTYCSTETQKANANVSHWGFGDRKYGRESVSHLFAARWRVSRLWSATDFQTHVWPPKQHPYWSSARALEALQWQKDRQERTLLKHQDRWNIQAVHNTHTYTVRCVCAGNGSLSSRLGRKTGCWWWPRH